MLCCSLTVTVPQNVHAIGDRTNGAVLDAYEKALEGVNVSEIRPRIEHAQIMKHSDSARLGQLGGNALLFD